MAKYYLNDDDRDSLKRAVRNFNQSPQRQIPSLFPPDTPYSDSQSSPDMYIAFTGESGIPAATPDISEVLIPGSVVCDIHFLNTKSVEQISKVFGFQHKIYNVSEEAIPSNTWIPVFKDKYGTWFNQIITPAQGYTGTATIIPETGTGTSTGGGGTGNNCDSYKVICENGYLRLYKCTADNVFTYVGDLETPCRTNQTTPPVGTASPAPPPTPIFTPVSAFDFISRVCIERQKITDAAESYSANWGDGVIQVDTTSSGLTITLPDPSTDPNLQLGKITGVFTVKNLGGNTVAVGTAGGLIDGTTFYSLPNQWDWMSFYHDGTDWFSGVGHPIIGFTIQPKRIILRTAATLQELECETDPVSCCIEETGDDTGGACCPNGAETTLVVSAYAPVSLFGEEVLFNGSMSIGEGNASWVTNPPIQGSGSALGGASDASLWLTIYCLGDGWTVEGILTYSDGQTYNFQDDLTNNGDDLYAAILLPNGEYLVIVIQHPCPTATFASGECAEVSCGECTVISTAYTVKDETDTIITTVILRTDLSCTWTSDGWKLEYVAGVTSWILTAPDGRTWELNNEEWNCCDTNIMIPEGEYAGYSVVPVYDCCPEESGTATSTQVGTGTGASTFNCTSGQCVEVLGPGGTHATIGQCVSACGTLPCNQCPSIPEGKTIVIGLSKTGGCSSIDSTATLSETFNSFFNGAANINGVSVNSRVGCNVIGGNRQWSIDFTTTGSVTGGTGIFSVVGGNCNQLVATVNITCSGVAATVTVTIDDYYFCTNPPCP